MTLNLVLISVGFILFASFLFLPLSSLEATSGDSIIFPPNSTPYGVPYSEWLGLWWKYWLGIPNNEHPAIDYNSDKCSIHQEGPVWFLPDVITKGDAPYTRVEFSCVIPKEKAILFPISTGSCWLGIPEFKHIQDKLSPRPDVDAELKRCAVGPQDNTEIFYVRVDGTDIKNGLARVTTSFYNVTTPKQPVTDIYSGIESGTSRAIANGYFVFLRPLSQGEHIIEFSVEDLIQGQKYAREGKYTISTR